MFEFQYSKSFTVIRNVWRCVLFIIFKITFLFSPEFKKKSNNKFEACCIHAMYLCVPKSTYFFILFFFCVHLSFLLYALQYSFMCTWVFNILRFLKHKLHFIYFYRMNLPSFKFNLQRITAIDNRNNSMEKTFALFIIIILV